MRQTDFRKKPGTWDNRPFWLSRHEVTRGQFRRFVDDRGYQAEAERDGKGGYGLVDGQSVQDPRFIWILGFRLVRQFPPSSP